ncbi:endonuclease [Nostoc sp. 'Peltigera membranacea cyanobiont' 232]|uniref:endonuclease n=1 Tax=Nostoc sp. 'Peltigera membranacea cyanobiont' 232 TaxID=2014531 RepID=UPI000B959D3B|nr:endonuclease [Nostoc sp. 'Peltigera membranacea cyanobiont' 232]OYE01228.1 endonuclease I [Nostoc sp. 'Peltigera membranacea cyanobiont' 232]
MKFIKFQLLSVALIFFVWISPLHASPIAQLPTSLLPVSQQETTSLKNSQDVLTVATFNVENLDPKDRRFDNIAKIIGNNLNAPDVISLVEVQDNNGPVDDDVVDANETYQKLIAALKNIGSPTYDFVEIAPSDDQDGGEPGGNIRVGLLFQPSRITLAKLPRKGGSLDAVAITQGANGLDLSLNPGRIDPTNSAFEASRKPLATEFIFNGQKVFIIANHFVSKKGGSPTDVKRVKQAEIVNEFVGQILEADPQAKVIVLGDLNDLPDSLPLKTLKGNILENLTDSLPASDRFTFKFKGNPQLIDHLLVSENLSRVAQPKIDIVHVNVGFSKPVSDHDPVIAAFTLPANQSNDTIPPVVQPTPTPVSDSAIILPQLSKVALVEELAKEYTPSKPLNYDRAKDEMFGIIDNQAGIVTDIYANYQIRLNGNGDPSQEADKLGLNTEHVWPQSKGAENGNAKSDLHHLFPAREDINSERGNKPFDDIADTKTKKWYRNDTVQSTIPTSAIDEFSESASAKFEPREKVKGDIARAVFYFYTIYRNQADKVDRNYFQNQRQTLCKWNQQDLPDITEIERSRAIAKFQGNDNPFVLDVTLAKRAYCDS